MSNGHESSDNGRGLSAESKVGLFVLAGLSLAMIGILMLGDVEFRRQTHLYITFRNIEGITDKSPVKISGVEVGSVKEVELEDHRAKVKIAIQQGIPVYQNAKARVRSTGIIGTKYLAFDPGKPVEGIPEEDQRLKPGAVVMGEDVMSLDELMERVAKSLDSFTGDGSLGKNLNQTMANLRSITDALNQALGRQQESLVQIVRNIESFSSSAKSVAANVDDLIADRKADIDAAIVHLRGTVEKLDGLLAKIQQGEGAVGALVADPKAGKEVKETITNLKETTESAKQVIGRFTKIRAFWEITGRRDFDAGAGRADLGLRIEPRPDKFYYVAGENLGEETTSKDEPGDYERRNTITALLGRHWGPFTAAVGFIKSRGGLEARVRPFQDTRVPVMNKFEMFGQVSDLGREDVIKGRLFDHPIYTAGGRFQVNKWVNLGLQWEDMAEVSDLTGRVNISFEDKDIAYLLGFVSFAR